MFEIIFYKDKNGTSEIVNHLDELQESAKTSKDAKINREKILTYLSALSQYGTRIGKPIVKYLGDNLWELRPLRTRIFFFYLERKQICSAPLLYKKIPTHPKKRNYESTQQFKRFFRKE